MKTFIKQSSGQSGMSPDRNRPPHLTVALLRILQRNSGSQTLTAMITENMPIAFSELMNITIT